MFFLVGNLVVDLVVIVVAVRVALDLSGLGCLARIDEPGLVEQLLFALALGDDLVDLARPELASERRDAVLELQLAPGLRLLYSNL